MSRLFRYYQERANEVAFLGGMVNILAIVGIGINIHDMKETQKMEQMLLSKQWVSTAAEEVQFSGKVGCFFPMVRLFFPMVVSILPHARPCVCRVT